jgi:type I restriction enzyme S subunit
VTSLPPGWKEVPLGEIATSMQNGIYRPATAYADDGVPCLRMYNISDGRIVWRDVKRMRLTPGEVAQYLLQPGDILVNRVNSRELVGKAAVITSSMEPAVYESKNIRLRVDPGRADSRYVNFRLLQAGSRYFNHNAQQTVGMASINQTQLAAFPIPLPPLSEQHSIVAEIEKHFTRLDSAIESLKQAQTKLKAYRATVLNAAILGQLVPTEAEIARREGRTSEDAVNWLTSQLGDENRWRIEGPERPPGWCWTRLGHIAELKGGITKGQKRKPADRLRTVPYLRVANVQRGYLDLSVVKSIEATDEEIRQSSLQAGDVLFNEGGDRDKLGRGWIWQGELPECIHQNHVFRARLRIPLNPKFLSWFGNSAGQAYFYAEGKHTTNLASINLTKLSALPVPVPPPAEQRRIVAEVDRHLFVIESTEESLTNQLIRAATLREGILTTAFRGGFASVGVPFA